MVLASYNWGIVSWVVRMAPGPRPRRLKETRNYIAEIPGRIYDWFASFRRFPASSAML